MGRGAHQPIDFDIARAGFSDIALDDPKLIDTKLLGQVLLAREAVALQNLTPVHDLLGQRKFVRACAAAQHDALDALFSQMIKSKLVPPGRFLIGDYFDSVISGTGAVTGEKTLPHAEAERALLEGSRTLQRELASSKEVPHLAIEHATGKAVGHLRRVAVDWAAPKIQAFEPKERWERVFGERGNDDDGTTGPLAVLRDAVISTYGELDELDWPTKSELESILRLAIGENQGTTSVRCDLYAELVGHQWPKAASVFLRRADPLQVLPIRMRRHWADSYPKLLK